MSKNMVDDVALETELANMIKTFGLFSVSVWSEMDDAIKSGNLAKVKILDKLGFEEYDDSTYNIVCCAAEHGQLEILKYLVHAGYDECHFGGIALEIAAESGHLDVVKYLVSIGLNIELPKPFQRAVSKAVQNGHFEIVKYLVSLGGIISKDIVNYQKYIVFCEKNVE